MSSRRTSQTKKQIGALVIVGAVCVLLLWLVPQLLGGLAALVITPIQVTKTWMSESTGNLPLYFRDRNDLIAENIRLQQKLDLEGGTDYTVALLLEENETLRSLLGDEHTPRVMAAVIGRPTKLPYDVLVIDRGSRDGIALNTPVYIGEDRVIGIITKVFYDSAVVELVTTPGFVTSVFVVGPDIYTNAVGLGGGQMRVGVPQGINLSKGNSVILPAVQSGVFGTISHIESEPTNPEQYGYVSTDVPLQSLRLVAVGTTPMKEVTFAAAEEIVETGLSKLFSVPVPDDLLVRSTSTATTTATVATTTSTTGSNTSSNNDAL